jgi:hypothetical protein
LEKKKPHMKLLSLLSIVVIIFFAACSTFKEHLKKHFTDATPVPDISTESHYVSPVVEDNSKTIWVNVQNETEFLGLLVPKSPTNSCNRVVNLGQNNQYPFVDTGDPVMFKIITIEPNGKRYVREYYLTFPPGAQKRATVEM